MRPTARRMSPHATYGVARNRRRTPFDSHLTSTPRYDLSLCYRDEVHTSGPTVTTDTMIPAHCHARRLSVVALLATVACTLAFPSLPVVRDLARHSRKAAAGADESSGIVDGYDDEDGSLANMCECQCCYEIAPGKKECLASPLRYEVSTCRKCEAEQCSSRFPNSCASSTFLVQSVCVERKSIVLQLVPVCFALGTIGLLIYSCYASKDVGAVSGPSESLSRLLHHTAQYGAAPLQIRTEPIAPQMDHVVPSDRSQSPLGTAPVLLNAAAISPPSRISLPPPSITEAKMLD